MPWHSSGLSYELSLIFFLEGVPFYNILNIFQPLNGFLVIVHSPDVFSMQSSLHFYLTKQTIHNFVITPEIVTIADELKSWPVHSRNCFLPGEKKLKYFRIYTKSGCEQECLSKAAFKACKCVPFYLIRKDVLSKNLA